MRSDLHKQTRDCTRAHGAPARPGRQPRQAAWRGPPHRQNPCGPFASLVARDGPPRATARGTQPRSNPEMRPPLAAGRAGRQARSRANAHRLPVVVGTVLRALRFALATAVPCAVSAAVGAAQSSGGSASTGSPSSRCLSLKTTSRWSWTSPSTCQRTRRRSSASCGAPGGSARTRSARGRCGTHPGSFVDIACRRALN